MSGQTEIEQRPSLAWRSIDAITEKLPFLASERKAGGKERGESGSRRGRRPRRKGTGKKMGRKVRKRKLNSLTFR